MPASVTDIYREARELLQDLSTDDSKAVREFAWPQLGDRFNWAVDWFDANARGNDSVALWHREGRLGGEYSFGEMARRSDQVAAHLAGHGVARGDHVVLMLNNQVELWESMLAVMKIGAVIMPTTTALRPHDLVDRIERGTGRHVIANPADSAKFDSVPGTYTRFVVGAAHDGWLSYAEAYEIAVPPAVHHGTAPSNPQLLCLTSGTTCKPELVEHTQVSYPPPVEGLADPSWRRSFAQDGAAMVATLCASSAGYMPGSVIDLSGGLYEG